MKVLVLFVPIVLLLVACTPTAGSVHTLVMPAVSSTPRMITEPPAGVQLQAPVIIPTSTLSAITGRIISGMDGAVAYIRSGPGTSYDRIGTLVSGQPLKITGRTPHNDWWRVMTDNVEGWIFADYVIVEGNAQAIPCIGNPSSECQVTDIPTENGQAITVIRTMKANADLQVTFLREENNPNADMRKALIYTDEQGDEYWIDSRTLQLVQWTPHLPESVGKIRPVEDLRIAAIAFAGQNSRFFQRHATALTFTGNTKDGSTYAFRWEDRSAAGHVMPPFLQIVVRTDGVILGYINTLDVLGP